MDPDEPEPEPARPDCALDQDGRIWIGPGSAERLRDCRIPDHAVLSIGVVAEAEQPSHRQHRRKEHRMEPQVTAPSVPTPETSDATTTDTTKDAVVAQVVDDGTKAHEVQEAPTASPIAGSDVAAIAGNNPLLAFGLALLAVFATGGAGWKLWTKKAEAAAELAKLQAEQAHELAMKQLEVQTTVPTTQPPPCQVKQAEVDVKLFALSSELSELRARLEKAEKKAAAFGDNFDADEVKDNLTKLERTVRDMKAKMPKPPTKK